MTDQELQKLARAYAEAMCLKEDYAKGDYIDLEERNIELDMYCDEAMHIIQWLAKSYCIVSREKVSALEDNIHGNIMYAHDKDDWQEVAHYILDVMPRRFIAIFGEQPFDNPKQEEV